MVLHQLLHHLPVKLRRNQQICVGSMAATMKRKSAEKPVISMVCRLMKGYIRDDQNTFCLPRQDLSGNSETTIFHGLRAGKSPIYYQFTTRSLDTIHPLMPTGIRATAIPQDCCGAYPPLPPPYARLWPSTPAPPVAGHPVTVPATWRPSEQQKAA